MLPFVHVIPEHWRNGPADALQGADDPPVRGGRSAAPAGPHRGGHRTYGRAHLERLDFIRHAREFGFTLEAVRALLALSDHPERPCEEVHALASGQFAAVEGKLRRLETLRAELARMTDACRGGTAGDCRILETLADHSHGHCASPDHSVPDTIAGHKG